MSGDIIKPDTSILPCFFYTLLVYFETGAEGEDRTRDLWFTIPLLYQLSYLGNGTTIS